MDCMEFTHDDTHDPTSHLVNAGSPSCHTERAKIASLALTLHSNLKEERRVPAICRRLLPSTRRNPQESGRLRLRYSLDSAAKVAGMAVAGV